jgi:serine protease DegS
MRDLLEYGEVIRGWLGMSVEPVGIDADNGAPGKGLSVVAVVNGSPAQKAGVQMGDIFTHINGEPVRDGRLTMHRIALLKPGESVEIAVLRDRQSIELNAIVGVLNHPLNSG